VSRFRITRRRVTVAVISTLAAAGIAVAVLAPSSGADFSASDTGSVHVATATLDLSLSDDNHTGTFDANFVNLAPGHANWQAKTFTVKNTGSITANVKVGGPLSCRGPGEAQVPGRRLPGPDLGRGPAVLDQPRPARRRPAEDVRAPRGARRLGRQRVAERQPRRHRDGDTEPGVRSLRTT
jgi:hypothetical protein